MSRAVPARSRAVPARSRAVPARSRAVPARNRTVPAGTEAVPVREHHVAAGRRGEAEALSFLLAKGYRLRMRNYRSGRGEIDLVMEAPGGWLVFVEVKANRSTASGHPLERVDGRKIRRLQRMAQRYCLEHRLEDRDIRFDVIGIDLRDTGPAMPGDAGGGSGAAVRVQHIENAFLPDAGAYYPSR
jgi:putative endonuclease